jgi:putative metallohydrolase (TIGR04338 family)
MSTKYPDWYELPKERWQEHQIVEWGKWDEEAEETVMIRQKHRFWRDSQRQKVYDAENGAKYYYGRGRKESSISGNQIRDFDSLDEIRQYVEKVLRSTWIVKRFGHLKMPTIVMTSDRSAYCRKADQTLNFPKWSWDQVVVLHEISHWIHPTGYGTPHGRFFARTFLELTGHEIGPEFRKVLKERYKFYRVRSSPFPVYSEETLKKKQEIGRRLAERRLDLCR